MRSLLDFADLLGGVLFAATSIVVGVRLLWLARQTRQLPELLMGLAFAVAGCVGYFLGIIGSFVDVPASLEPIRPYVSRALISIGSVLVAIATWRIFFAHSARARAAVWIVGVLLLFEVFPLSLGTADGEFLSRRATQLVLLFPFAWMSWASLRLRQSLLRRWRIGLGEEDPDLARRLGLWGLGTASIAGLFLTNQVVNTVNHFTSTHLPEELLVAVWGIACAAFMWLAFFGSSSQRPNEAGS